MLQPKFFKAQNFSRKKFFKRPKRGTFFPNDFETMHYGLDPKVLWPYTVFINWWKEKLISLQISSKKGFLKVDAPKGSVKGPFNFKIVRVQGPLSRGLFDKQMIKGEENCMPYIHTKGSSTNIGEIRCHLFSHLLCHKRLEDVTVKAALLSL